MNFLHPELLFALSAIAIPIIIHLFNLRRYKKVYFTNVRFLRDIQQSTQAKSKLKHWLVLACRILALSCIVLAFAQPYIPVENKAVETGNKHVSIYVDNSFSMDAVNDNGSLLNNAKKMATEIVKQYASTDQFQIITNNFEARHQHFVGKEDAFNLIEEIVSSSNTRTLSEINTRQKELLNSQNVKNGQCYIISDFQLGMADWENISNDTISETQLIPLSAQNVQNIYVDSCWFSSPVRQLNKVDELNVRIRNVSSKKIENNPIKLMINGKQKALSSYTVEPDAYADVKLSFTPTEVGIQSAEVSITDYPVTFDDNFFLSYQINNQISVLCINGDSVNRYLNNFFIGDSSFIFATIFEKQIDYASLSKNNLIVLNSLKNISSGLSQELNHYVKNGGTVAVFPHGAIDSLSYTTFLNAITGSSYLFLNKNKTKIDKINTEHSIFSDLFEKKPENINLPSVSLHYSISKPIKSTAENLMKLENGDDFLNQYSFEKGMVYLFATPLDLSFSNFPMHAIFVPVIYKIALNSMQNQAAIYQTIATNQSIEANSNLTGDENVFHLKNAQLNVDIIPEHRNENGKTNLLVNDQITTAGNYDLVSETGNKISAVAFNYNRKESLLKYNKPEELLADAEKLGIKQFSVMKANENSVQTAVAEINMGKRFWKLCLFLALLFLGLEVLLLRFWNRS